MFYLQDTLAVCHGETISGEPAYGCRQIILSSQQREKDADVHAAMRALMSP